MALTGAHRVGMPPLIITPVGWQNWRYLEGDSYTAFIPAGSTTGVPLYDGTKSWGTLDRFFILEMFMAA